MTVLEIIARRSIKTHMLRRGASVIFSSPTARSPLLHVSHQSHAISLTEVLTLPR